MSTVAVHLDAQLDAFVEEKVRSGAFDSASDVLAQALGDMARNDAFQAAIQLGLDDFKAGDVIEIDDIPAWIDGLGRD